LTNVLATFYRNTTYTEIFWKEIEFYRINDIKKHPKFPVKKNILDLTDYQDSNDECDITDVIILDNFSIKEPNTKTNNTKTNTTKTNNTKTNTTKTNTTKTNNTKTKNPFQSFNDIKLDCYSIKDF
jgi:hypothetical protein